MIGELIVTTSQIIHLQMRINRIVVIHRYFNGFLSEELTSSNPRTMQKGRLQPLFPL